MRQYELVERVRKYNPRVDEDLLNRAYVYAMKAHGAQKRASGDPYFSHPLEVAAILTDLKLDDANFTFCDLPPAAKTTLTGALFSSPPVQSTLAQASPRRAFRRLKKAPGSPEPKIVKIMLRRY